MMKSILIFFLTTGSLLAEDISFEKFYLNNLSEFHLITQSDDDNYIISGLQQKNDITQAIFVKTNAKGTVEWIKSFASIPAEVYYRAVYIGNDEGYLLLNTIMDGELKKIILSQLDHQGNLFWSKVFNDHLDQVSYSLRALSDGDYLIGAIKDNYIGVLIKCTAGGDSIWQKEFNLSTFRSKDFQLIETLDDNLLLAYKNYIMKLNLVNGDIIWEKKMSGSVHLAVQDSSGDFYFAGKNTLIKTDSMANQLFQQTLENDPYKMLLHKNTLHFCGYKILKTSLDGNEIYNEQLDGLLYDFVMTSDGGYAYAGKNTGMRKTGWLLKTDKEDYYQSLNVTYPDSGNYIISGEDYLLEWRSRNVERIKLALSTDGGKIYNTIAENVAADSQKFNFLVPFDTSGRCLLYIESESSPQLNDTSDGFFKIGIRNYFEEILVNNMNYFFSVNGSSWIYNYDYPWTLLWPDMDEPLKGLISDDGLVFAGKAGNDFYAAGQYYGSSLSPGNILDNGMPAERKNERMRIWKFSPGWELLPEGVERDVLEYNVMNWPVDLGAPYNDLDNNGIYDPSIDSPQSLGDENYWFITNDFNEEEMAYKFGSVPIGIEIQYIISAYKSDNNDLDDVLFKKYVLKNKGSSTIENFALGYWVDPDLGWPTDDYVGCDTLLNLGYCYNNKNDESVYGAPAPAMGIMILQGPVVESSDQDSAYFNNNWIYGYKNAAMDAFLMYTCGSNICSPENGQAGQWYNVLHGLDTDGATIFNPVSGKETSFSVSGDPVAGTGWYEGAGWPDGPNPGDRYMTLGSGSFTFAPGDSQEFVIAIIAARGDNNLDSITELKRKAAAVKEFYYTGILPTSINDIEMNSHPQKFILYQNYPNPFNAITNFEFQIPNFSHVELSVYNVLGQKVATLLDEKRPAGQYKVTFDATGLASGIYYYKLIAGDFVQTRKMLLLK